MKTLIIADKLEGVYPVGRGLLIEANMSEAQMFATLSAFLDHVSDDVWSEWQRKINKVYEEQA